MTLFALRHVVTHPMTLLVAEAPRLFLVGQEGDQRLHAPVDGGCVVSGFPAWDTVIEVEKAHMRNRRLKTDDVGCLVECLEAYIADFLGDSHTPFDDDPSRHKYR